MCMCACVTAVWPPPGRRLAAVWPPCDHRVTAVWPPCGRRRCCQGSGIEAFARLADAIFWEHVPSTGTAASATVSGARTMRWEEAARRAGGVPYATSPHLFILQLLPSELSWEERGVRVSVRGDYPGAVDASRELNVVIDVSGLGPPPRPPRPGSARDMVVWVRLPSWATRVEATATGGITLLRQGEPRPDTLLPALVTLTSPPSEATPLHGSLQLTLTPRLLWEPVKDSRPEFSVLQASQLCGLASGRPLSL